MKYNCILAAVDVCSQGHPWKSVVGDLLTTESQSYVDKTNVYRCSWKHPICCFVAGDDVDIKEESLS